MADNYWETDEGTFWYHLRIHQVDGVNITSLAEFLLDWIDGPYLFAEETKANREHFHGIFLSNVKIQTLRVRIKRAFPGAVGNNGYSLKVARKPAELARYICKGASKDEPPNIRFQNGHKFTSGWIGEQHELYWQHELAEARELKHEKARINEIIWERVDAIKGDISVEKVVNIILDCWTSVGKMYDIYTVRRFRNVIMSRYCKNWKKLMESIINTDDVCVALVTRKYNNQDIYIDEGF